jgi:cell division protein FtsW (lipid II flippase)
MRRSGLDRSLLLIVALLLAFGVLMVYSAGQTDVPTAAHTAWIKQLIWVGLGILAGAIVFRVNFRILEWAAPGIYALGVILLVATLVVGTGAGSAASSKSWLAIGGYRIGQPVELAKLATILLLARYLSSLRDPPQTLRELLAPAFIAGVPGIAPD